MAEGVESKTEEWHKNKLFKQETKKIKIEQQNNVHETMKIFIVW